MTDAFSHLTELTIDDSPSDEFAARLRVRLAASATSTITLIRTPTIPDRSNTMPQTITPYLCVSDAHAAIEWYRTHFRAMVINVIEDGSRIGHAELEFGGATFFLADEYPEIGVVSPTTLGVGSATSFVVLVADVDASIERAVTGGAILQRPVSEAHGTRSGWILDPFGHRWNIGTPVADRAAAQALRRPSEPYYMTLSTADVERGSVFYGAVLDWTFAEVNDNGGRHITNTKFPIGLRPTVNAFTTTAPGEIEMWFTVRDFDDAVERVRIAGGTVLTITGYDSGREARCEDDQGVLFRLSQPAPGYDAG